MATFIPMLGSVIVVVPTTKSLQSTPFVVYSRLTVGAELPLSILTQESDDNAVNVSASIGHSV